MGLSVRRVAFVAIAGIFTFACFGLFPTLPARAAGGVTNCDDSGAGSLRAAIVGGGLVTFPAGLNCSGANAITLTSGTLTIAADTTIDGTGATIVVDGNNAVTVFTISSGVTANISALTIQHGLGTGGGGGINNTGTVTVTNSTFSGNHTSGFGAAGGGINNTGTATVTNSTFSGNLAFRGGGIFNGSGNTLTVTNSTFTGNSAPGSPGGGGIDNEGGTVTVTNSTFTANTSGSGPGGIVSLSGTTLTNTLIASNSGGDLGTGGGGTFTGNNNLIDDSTISDLSGTGNLDQPALLGTLGTYGGPTQTFPLLPGSPAIDAGSTATCQNTSGTAPVAGKDQRGVPRPVGACDIGAFESRGFTFSNPTGTPQSALITTQFATPLGVTVSANASGEPVDGGQVTFTATPVGGASATFAPNPATIASGKASVMATANSTVGGPYLITPNAAGVTGSVSVSLTNTTPTTTVAANATATFNTNVQAVTLTATVTSPAGTVSAGTVTFTVLQGATVIGSAVTSSTLTNGTVSVSYPLPANTFAATDMIQAIYNAGGFFATSQDSTHTLTVMPVALTLSPQSLANGAIGVADSQNLTASGGSGTGYAFAVTSGSLPAGLHLSSGGALTGTPTATGTSTFTVTATDSANNTGMQTYTLTIDPAPLVSLAVTPAGPTLKVGQVQQFVATGTYADSTTADVTSQVTWSSDAAAIATVDASGTGTGMSPGTAHITAAHGSVSGHVSVTVSAPTPIGIAPVPHPANRPAGTTNQPSATPATSGTGRGGTTGETAPAPAPPGR